MLKSLILKLLPTMMPTRQTWMTAMRTEICLTELVYDERGDVLEISLITRSSIEAPRLLLIIKSLRPPLMLRMFEEYVYG
jgi:hypothetical protein